MTVNNNKASSGQHVMIRYQFYPFLFLVYWKSLRAVNFFPESFYFFLFCCYFLNCLQKHAYFSVRDIIDIFYVAACNVTWIAQCLQFHLIVYCYTQYLFYSILKFLILCWQLPEFAWTVLNTEGIHWLANLAFVSGEDNLSDRAGSVSPLNTSYDRVSVPRWC